MLKLIFQSLKNSSNSNGPWGPWGGGNGNSTNSSDHNKSSQNNHKNNSSNQKPNNKKPSNHEDFITKIINKISKYLKNFSNPAKSDSNPPKSGIGLMILGIIILYLSFGFYKVDPDENAVTLYFGKYYRIAQPGLNYHIPYPFGSVIKKSVTTVNTEEFGFSSNKRSNDSLNRNFNAESLMLTGDENIVDIQFQIQWQIADIKDFVFNIAEPNQSIRKSAESAMRNNRSHSNCSSFI